MSIVSSVIAVNSDVVHEDHTDHTGRVWRWTWHPPVGTDLQAALAAHATILTERLAELEADGILNG